MVAKLPHARAAVIALLVVCAGFVVEARAAEPLAVSDAWVRVPAPGQKVAGAYMELKSEGDSALVGVASAVAGRAELHTMKLDAGVMKMRAVERIDLPAKQAVKLAPGGMHIMLMDLKRPLKEGDTVPLTLSIRSGGAMTQLNVEARVRAAGVSMPHNH